ANDAPDGRTTRAARASGRAQRAIAPVARPRLPPAHAAPPDDPVLRLWGGDAVCAVDVLAARAGDRGLWPPGRAPAALLESLLQLELRGLVRRLPGAAYERTA